MGLFGFLGSKPFDHPQFGQLVRSHGKWTGRLSWPGQDDVALELSGDKSSPGPKEVALATEVGARFEQVRPAIERALFEHYEPYGAAIDAGELEPPDEPLPRIAGPSGVWPYVTLEAVTIDSLGTDDPVVEFVFETEWDVEHRVGARVSGTWEFIELCGSV